MATINAASINAALANLNKAMSGGIPTPAPIVVNNASPSILAQILSGVQAGSQAAASYYQGQAVVNQARAEADAAKYLGVSNAQYPVSGVQATASGDATMPIMLFGMLMLFMMMSDKGR